MAIFQKCLDCIFHRLTRDALKRDVTGLYDYFSDLPVLTLQPGHVLDARPKQLDTQLDWISELFGIAGKITLRAFLRVGMPHLIAIYTST